MSKQNIIYISSKDPNVIADPNGFLSSFSVPLDVPISNVKGVDLITINIPNTIYPINENNNKFDIVKTDRLGVAELTETYTIPPSFYTPINLAIAVEAQFLASGSVQFQGFKCAYNTNTQHFTISSELAENFKMVFTGNRAWEGLGFEVDEKLPELIFNQVAESTTKPRAGLSYLFMTSNIPTHTMTTLKRKRYNILAKMDLMEEAKANTMLSYNVSNLGVTSFETNIDYLEKLDFVFTDFLGRPVLFYDVPNVEISMKIVVWSD